MREIIYFHPNAYFGRFKASNYRLYRYYLLYLAPKLYDWTCLKHFISHKIKTRGILVSAVFMGVSSV